MTKTGGTKQRSTSVAFIGGLGNRLFQLAAGLTAQQIRGGDLEFYDGRTLTRWPVEEFLERPSIEDLPGQFMGIPFVYQFGYVNRAYWFARRQPRRLARSVRHRRRAVHALRQWNGFAEIPADFIDDADRSVDLHGYFQHPSWFEAALPVVTGEVWRRVNPIADQLRELNGTVISLRLGDYRRFGAVLQPTYYRRALKALGTIVGPVWIVSQEQDAHELLSPLLNECGLRAQPLPKVPVNDLVRDLALLSAAENVIMSNSTFCWWGVVTGQLHNGVPPGRVLAPDRWLPHAPESGAMIRSDWLPVPASFMGEEAHVFRDGWRPDE